MALNYILAQPVLWGCYRHSKKRTREVFGRGHNVIKNEHRHSKKRTREVFGRGHDVIKNERAM